MKHAVEKKKSKLPLIIILVLLLLALILGLGLWFLSRDSSDGLEYEGGAIQGTIGGGIEDLEAMQEMVDRGMITMSINATPMWNLSDKNAGVNWQIENPEAQSTKLIRVEVIRDDTQEKIYETGAIKPGTYVSGTKPDVDLEAGEYSCTAYFYSYDIDTQEFLGKAGTQITLYVVE